MNRARNEKVVDFFAFQIFADIVISINQTRCRACNRKSQLVEQGVELAVKLKETLFSYLNLILS